MSHAKSTNHAPSAAAAEDDAAVGGHVTPTVTDEQTAALRSGALRELTARGLLFQCTDIEALDERMAAGSLVAYNGYDLTAPSLHVGNLVTLMILRTLQRHGHRPIVLLGGGTTKVGDPSGKDEARPLLDAPTIAENRTRIAAVVTRFLEFEGGSNAALMVDNEEWLDELGYIDFLRTVGRHFTINRMLQMESVARRLEREEPLTFLEFNYMLLQAYDFVELHRRYGCTLQTGGSDQWGNIVQGVELGRRMANVSLGGLTAPLLLTADGKKMGKTAAGALWLSADMLDPWDFWQYWRNVDDAEVAKLLCMFTDLDERELERLAALEGRDVNEAKIALATELTGLVHGNAAAERAKSTAEKTFDGGGVGAALPVVEVPAAELRAGIPAFALIGRSNLVASNSAARRLVDQGGARINDQRVTDAEQLITLDDVTAEGTIKVSAGRKKHALVRPV